MVSWGLIIDNYLNINYDAFQPLIGSLGRPVRGGGDYRKRGYGGERPHQCITGESGLPTHFDEEPIFYCILLLFHRVLLFFGTTGFPNRKNFVQPESLFYTGIFRMVAFVLSKHLWKAEDPHVHRPILQGVKRFIR
jgi:hypothetical protein